MFFSILINEKRFEYHQNPFLTRRNPKRCYYCMKNMLMYGAYLIFF